MKWVVEMDGTSPQRIGPFDDRAEADDWAARYADRLSEREPMLLLSWEIVPVTEPGEVAA